MYGKLGGWSFWTPRQAALDVDGETRAYVCAGNSLIREEM
jgi:hypothetical protein